MMSPRHSSQVAPLVTDIDINDRLNVVMVDHRRPNHRRQLHELLSTCAGSCIPLALRFTGTFDEFLQAGHLILRRLDGHLIFTPFFGFSQKLGSV